MKTTLNLFTIAYFVWLSLITLQAMEAPAGEQSYQLVGIINDEVIGGRVTCVKQIADQYLVVFQNSGAILLYDLNNLKKFINQWGISNNASTEIWCVENIFLYQDQDDQSLLIAYDNDIGLHVCNLNKKYTCHTILINHEFEVVQVMVGSKKTLVMINIEDNSAFPIDLTWAALEDADECRPSYETLFPINPVHEFDLDHVLDHVIDEGLVADRITLTSNKQFALSGKMFDIKSLTENEKELLCYSRKSLMEIISYHKKDKILYLGHDAGRVGIWRPKK